MTTQETRHRDGMNLSVKVRLVIQGGMDVLSGLSKLEISAAKTWLPVADLAVALFNVILSYYILQKVVLKWFKNSPWELLS